MVHYQISGPQFTQTGEMVCQAQGFIKIHQYLSGYRRNARHQWGNGQARACHLVQPGSGMALPVIIGAVEDKASEEIADLCFGTFEFLSKLVNLSFP